MDLNHHILFPIVCKGGPIVKLFGGGGRETRNKTTNLLGVQDIVPENVFFLDLRKCFFLRSLLGKENVIKFSNK